ncbi:phosphomannomutase CpsG [Parashewanella hymeniacidonis]|uniref:phosphomannomutase CpsG n=1 Tax=Parashewanella hymeniacidonis TaxID=2807618 RepID=UPI0023E829FE|nr:phosphomannomutase CpsG [Parashewanella hymeniacidonis]
MAEPKMTPLTCFKAYDIRGKLGSELDEKVAYDIGRAYAREIKPKTVVLGGDVRATSDSLKMALSEGLRAEGVDTIDIGLVGTEEIYFATPYLNVDGGIMVTASHNPIDYNGIKMVRKDSIPVSGDSGLISIKASAETTPWINETSHSKLGTHKTQSILAPYVEKLLTYIDVKNIKRLKIVVNSGNGTAGHVIDALELEFEQLNIPIEFVKLFHQPNANFPNGIPNPLLAENRKATSDAVIEHNADLGIAWDGDFDRCFLFDENGEFIEGYYIVGLLAEMFLRKNKCEKIIHDPRLTWNTEDIIKKAGGEAVKTKTGHAFIKERMRAENAVYGGEMSAHHYFRSFYYCDSGMIPWLLIIELISISNKSLSKLVNERISLYPSSGEINLNIRTPQEAIEAVKKKYQTKAYEADLIDGVSFSFIEKSGLWRFNLRCSNTEPVVRLNVESKGSRVLMRKKTKEIVSVLQEFRA